MLGALNKRNNLLKAMQKIKLMCHLVKLVELLTRVA